MSAIYWRPGLQKSSIWFVSWPVTGILLAETLNSSVFQSEGNRYQHEYCDLSPRRGKANLYVFSYRGLFSHKLTLLVACSHIVVLRSFDNVKFLIDKEELEVDTSGFPPATTPSYIGEVSSLPECSHILKILFQYVGTQSSQPVLDQIEFARMLEVAEAAEKYEVHKAIAAVQFELRWVRSGISYTRYSGFPCDW